MTASGPEKASTLPKVLQPSTMGSRRREREAAGRPARRGSTINRLDYSQPFTMPARVPVKDRPAETVIVVPRPGPLEKP